MKTSVIVTIFIVLVIGTEGNDYDLDCDCIPLDECNELWATAIIKPKAIDENDCGTPDKICCPLETETSTKAPSPLRECGKSNPHDYGSEQITNLQSQYAEFPWMIEISIRNIARSRSYKYVGGGSLIHPSVVLTAAHKVIDKTPNMIRIRAGEWDRNNINEPFPFEDRQVTDIIIHEQYNDTTLYNGIALLILETPMQISRHISPVCLRTRNYVYDDNTQCFISGWGKKPRERGSSSVDILKKITVPLIPSERCEELLRQTVLGNGFRLHESFLCAGGEPNKDTCFGDGGSPLVCRIPNTDIYYQAGIVSWGISCGQKDVPGGYIDVTKFFDWIISKISKIDPNFF